MTQEQKDVLAVVTNMTAAFHAKNIDAVMEAYEKGATILFEPGVPTKDRASQIEKFKGFFALNPTFTYSGHNVVVQGDTAVHFAPWTMAATAPDGTTMEQTGLSVAILKKQQDGRWLMIIDNPYGNEVSAQ